MKFYKGFVNFFLTGDVTCVVKIKLKYLRFIEMYFYGFFQTDVLIYFFIPLRWAEAITWENFEQT